MFVVFDIGQKVPIKIWLKDRNAIEANCLEQAMNLSRHPSVVLPVVLLPDVHKGKGMTVGGTICCQDIIPHAIGSDIGCGMFFVKTNIDAGIFASMSELRSLIDEVKSQIPVGFEHRKNKIEWVGFNEMPNITILKQEMESAKTQLGTLGSGNHFLEFQKDEDNKLCIMIHSGSRNLGSKICKHYNDIAIKLNEKYHSQAPKEWELAFLPIDSVEGQEYIKAMNFALDFAKENRTIMANIIMDILRNRFSNIEFYDIVNAHHNYAALEHHFGRDVWVHRKGAIRVRKDEMGIIPGSMGTKSYIVKGIGNELSYYTASHGAGRPDSRNSANKRITLEMAEKSMEGIVHDRPSQIQRGELKGQLNFSEYPDAYKNIDVVIADESDIIQVVKTLKPVGVIKGE